MEPFITKFQGSMYYLLGNPSSTLELVITLVLSLVLGTVILTALGDVLDISNISIFTAAMAMVLGSVITVAAVAVSSAYLPGLVGSKGHKYIPFIGIVAAALFLVSPTISLLLKGKYMSALTAWLGVLGSIAIIILGVGAIFDAVNTSKQNTSVELRRKSDIEHLLE